MVLTRRILLQAAGVSTLWNIAPKIALANNETGKKLRGISVFGELKYGADYTHFDYATPDAPKGGTFRFQPPNWGFNQNIMTFNTINTFVLKGEAPPRMELCFDTLMVGALDEPDAVYCALAKSITISKDYNTYSFELHEEAKFSDGTPVTAEDVAFSFNILKSDGHPSLSLLMNDLEAVETIGKNEVSFHFNGKQTSQAILQISTTLPILSKAFFEKHDFNTNTTVPHLGSGPYAVGRVSTGKYIEYERRPDYWAENLPFNKGLNHFQTLRIDFFRDRSAGFEAFKKGDIEFREEFTSKSWATNYDFPAVQDGRVKKELLPAEKQPSMQAWALNSRRKKLSNPKTRQAIGFCFDFEWTNKNLFFGAYSRSQSIFEKSEFKAEGKPSTEELSILERWKDKVPPAAFEEIGNQPITDGTGNNRKQLRQAVNLLKQAGWKRKDGKLVDEGGKPFDLEFLIASPSLETLHGKFVENLKKVGINASIRLVDPSQYQSRLEDFDFDIIMMASSMSATPGSEGLQQMLSSKYADLNGSRNYPAIRSEAIDGLLGEIGKVKTRKELTTVLRVVDRVLRPMHLWIPNWYSANHRLAWWDIYGQSSIKPDYGFPVEQLWWFDEAKAKAIGKA